MQNYEIQFQIISSVEDLLNKNINDDNLSENSASISCCGGTACAAVINDEN